MRLIPNLVFVFLEFIHDMAERCSEFRESPSRENAWWFAPEKQLWIDGMTFERIQMRPKTHDDVALKWGSGGARGPLQTLQQALQARRYAIHVTLGARSVRARR